MYAFFISQLSATARFPKERPANAARYPASMPLIEIRNDDWSIYVSTELLLSGAVEGPWDLFRSHFVQYEFPPTTPIFLTGVCTGDGKGSDSCNTICGDAESMFSSSEMLWNCLTLASLWQASRFFTNASGQALARQIERELTEVYPLNLSDFDGRTVFEHTYECAQKSCQDDGGDCDFSFDFAEGVLAGNTSMEGPFLDASFCNGVRAVPNLDIAGPGVSANFCYVLCVLEVLQNGRTITRRLPLTHSVDIHVLTISSGHVFLYLDHERVHDGKDNHRRHPEAFQQFR